MAAICLQAGLGQSLFRFAHVWFGRLSGGLAIAGIAASALFAAISASSMASVVTLGTIALPEMKRYKYDDALGAGSLAAGGGLGILIPPSGILIIYGIMTEQSIAKLFAAGLLPGIILTILYCLFIWGKAIRRPDIAPPGGRTSVIVKLRATGDAAEILLLIALVIVGIIIGWFTPTEAGAIGAFGALLLSLVRQRLSLKGFWTALVDSIKSTGMVFVLLIGAFVFTTFLALTTIPMEISLWVAGLGLPPTVIIVLIIVVYLILGMFIDSMAMILLTIPIFVPVMIELDVSLIWFGIIIVMAVEMALITPPVGMNVYVIHGLAPDIKLQTIFRGAVPFLVAQVVVIGLLILVPGLCLWLGG